MRQDPPAAVAPVIPARAPGGVSARRSGVATLAKPNVRPGVQPGWPVRRLASCAHPAGVSARIHASGWLPASRCAGRSQDAAAAGQSTTARTWPAPAVQAAASASAAPAEAVWRPWPMAIVSALEARSIRMSRSSSAAVWGCGARVEAGKRASVGSGTRGDAAAGREWVVVMVIGLSMLHRRPAGKRRRAGTRRRRRSAHRRRKPGGRRSRRRRWRAAPPGSRARP